MESPRESQQHEGFHSGGVWGGHRSWGEADWQRGAGSTHHGGGLRKSSVSAIFSHVGESARRNGSLLGD